MKLVPSPPQLQRWTYGAHDRLTSGYGTPKARYFRCVRCDADGYTLEDMDRRGFFEQFTLEQFAAFTQSPGYRCEPDYYDTSTAWVRSKRGVDNYADIPDREKPTVRYRRNWVTRSLAKMAAGEMTKSDASIRRMIPIIQAEIEAEQREAAKTKRPGATIELRKPPQDPDTLRTWINLYIDGGFNSAALRTNYRNCGDDGRDFPPEFELLIHQRTIEYSTETQSTQKGQYALLKADFMVKNAERLAAGLTTVEPPCDKRFFERIRLLPKFSVLAGRKGLEHARAAYYPSSGGLDTMSVGERVEIDETNVQLHVLAIHSGIWFTLSQEQRDSVARGRWWASVAMDHASKCWLAIRLIRNPSSLSSLATLSMAVSDKGAYADAVGTLSPWKQAVVPNVVASDSAKWFTNEFQDALLGIGGTPLIPTTGLPQLRGTLERSFLTAETALISRFSGRAFKDVVELGDYPAADRASITDDMLAWSMVRYVVDIYHNSPHEGLNGRTPFNEFDSRVDKYGLKPLPDKHVRRKVFGLKLRRVMRPTGVRILNLVFNSPELQRHLLIVGHIETDVKIDLTDIGWISVLLDEKSKRWLSVPCIALGLDNVHAEDWIRTRSYLRKQHAEEARLSQHIVLQTLAEIQKLSDVAVRFAIGTTMLTAREIDLAEYRLQIAWHARPDLPPEYGGSNLDEPFMSDSVRSPRTYEPPAADDPPESEPPQPRRRRFKDKE